MSGAVDKSTGGLGGSSDAVGVSTDGVKTDLSDEPPPEIPDEPVDSASSLLETGGATTGGSAESMQTAGRVLKRNRAPSKPERATFPSRRLWRHERLRLKEILEGAKAGRLAVDRREDAVHLLDDERGKIAELNRDDAQILSSLLDDPAFRETLDGDVDEAVDLAIDEFETY